MIAVQTNSFRGRGKFQSKSKGHVVDHPVRSDNCKYCVENHTIKAIALHLERKCGKCGKDNHFKAV